MFYLLVHIYTERMETKFPQKWLNSDFLVFPIKLQDSEILEWHIFPREEQKIRQTLALADNLQIIDNVQIDISRYQITE